MEKNENINLMMNHLIESWRELAQCLMQHPEKIINSQVNYWNEYQDLCQNQLQTTDHTSDKRFKHSEWHNNLILNFIKKSYLLTSKHIDSLMTDVSDQESKDTHKKLYFFARQYLDAISPTNFANINPEVASKIIETNGESIINGYQQLIDDIKQGNGSFNFTLSDMNGFKIGENIACTPGKVVYQNDLMQLIQYTATTDKVYQIPLLIIPPWINKYYILDLQQENSLVKWLIDKGLTVFMISWVNPTTKHKEKQFSDYLHEGPLTALKIIKKITKEKQTNVMGYCIGGTLLACMQAYLAKKHDTSIRSATFLTALIDFSEPGELSVFTDEKQINLLEKHMQVTGYLDGRVMSSVFNALRANDLIWHSFITHYLKGEKPKPFDLLFWNSDSTNIPAQVHSFYLRNMYLNNLLIQKNKIKLSNTSLDLSQITIPTYFLAAEDDHIVPWKTCYKGSQFIHGETRFVLTSSGHVAGVVNPPSRNKYAYRVSHNKHATIENFTTNSSVTAGSWWNDWVTWLIPYSGEKMNGRNIIKHKKLEDAPGSYVKVHVVNISKEE